MFDITHYSDRQKYHRIFKQMPYRKFRLSTKGLFPTTEDAIPLAVNPSNNIVCTNTLQETRE